MIHGERCSHELQGEDFISSDKLHTTSVGLQRDSSHLPFSKGFATFSQEENETFSVKKWHKTRESGGRVRRSLFMTDMHTSCGNRICPWEAKKSEVVASVHEPLH